MEDKTRKDQLQAVWFAAGTAVLIACVERAVVVSIFKQWHMWVFLALNLLLIAILFTSTYPPRNHSDPIPKSKTSQESGKKQPAAAVADSREDAVDDRGNVLNLGNEEREESVFSDDEDDNDNDSDSDSVDDGERSSSLLSNEELNERVEAFISRFRQQYLVSDVKIRRSSSDSVCGRAVFLKTVTV